MKLIPKSRKKHKKQPLLSLQIHVIQTKGIDIFDRFDCSPVCYVTTNNYFTHRTQQLSNSNSKWNQMIKMTLPKNPVNDLLRVIVYDVIPIDKGSEPNSTTSSHKTSNILTGGMSPLTSTSSRSLNVPRPKSAQRSSFNTNSYEVNNNSLGSMYSLRTMYSLATQPTHNHQSSSTHNVTANDNNNIQPQYIDSLDHINTSSTYSSGSPTYEATEQSTRAHKYMYIGEAQISLHELFRDPERNNHFHFNQLQQPKWYKLFDKKREKQYKDSTSQSKMFPIGDIQLGFSLSSNMRRQYTTLQAFIMWQQRLIKSVNWKRHRKLIKMKEEAEPENDNNDERESTPQTLPLSIPGSSVDYNDEEAYADYDDDNDEVDDIVYESLSQINTNSMSDISIISLNSAASTGMASTASNSDYTSDFNDSLSNDGDDQDEHEDSTVGLLDLNSLVSALDEYDVVRNDEDHILAPHARGHHNDQGDILKNRVLTNKDFEEIENILKEPPSVVHDIIDDTDNNSSNSQINVLRYTPTSPSPVNDLGYSEDSELSTDSENEHVNTSLQFKPNGSKLLRLRRRTKSNYSRHYDIDHHWRNNFKVSKKEHSLGVVFMEIQNITNLPTLKSRLSRRKYDMDPFVITTFGRRVFKTSSKNHTLNPYFNESIAFEIFPNETQFSFHFKVMDKDSISYHDEIAEYDLPWFDVLRQIKQDNLDGRQDWSEFHIPLEILYRQEIESHPMLKIKVRYSPYKTLKRDFWKHAVSTTTLKEEFDMVDLLLFLDKLGSFSDQDALEFFNRFNKLAWAGDSITRKELIKGLQSWKKTSEFKNVWKCPKCFKSRNKSNNSKRSKLTSENDLITHYAICCFSHDNKVLKPSYVSTEFASKRWFSKILIKLSYGRYALGSNNANILVQDRNTGVILEEKISAHVKVGLRIIYNGRGKESKRFRNLLKTLSVRQGKKFDNPASVKQIESFIQFHHLDMSQCMDTTYGTFNEFFYRKLKPGSRIIENKSPKYMVSPADSRLTVFPSVEKSKKIWIKSSKFTINRLTQDYNNDRYNNSNTSIAIFRLAPQDYHRFHCPCDVTIGKPINVNGEYYTVNPMAIRSELDVFGENIRTIIPMKSAEFGEFLMIAVGAMMVGSIVLTCKEGDRVEKGGEVGYFKFGGSTIILLIPSSNIKFDSDLINNTTEQIETLVKVGMSLGHTPDIKDMQRKRKPIIDSIHLEKIKRTISVTAENLSKIGDVTWQYDALTNLMKDDYGKEEVETMTEIPD